MRGSDRTAPARNGERDDRRADSSPATEHGRLLSLGSAAFFHNTDQFDRERRVSTSFSYIAAGLAVIAIGVAIEATR
jgi:hypothetical protein